jgi:hypothetical protein
VTQCKLSACSANIVSKWIVLIPKVNIVAAYSNVMWCDTGDSLNSYNTKINLSFNWEELMVNR